MSVADSLSLPAAAAPRVAAPRKPLRWQDATRWLLAWPVPLALLLIWYVAARNAWIPPQVLPAPEDVARTLAELHAVDVDELDRRTTANFHRLFRP